MSSSDKTSGQRQKARTSTRTSTRATVSRPRAATPAASRPRRQSIAASKARRATPAPSRSPVAPAKKRIPTVRPVSAGRTSTPRSRPAPLPATRSAQRSQRTRGVESKPVREPLFTLLARGHITMLAMPSKEVPVGLMAGSAFQITNATGLAGATSARKLSLTLATNPREFKSIDDLLEAERFSDVFPQARTRGDALTHYKSVFSRSARDPVTCLHFRSVRVFE